MKSKSINARKRAAKFIEHLPPAPIGRRIAWIALAAVWVFMFLSLASFNSADVPSHVVAVYNTPASNLCGRIGAVVAYWAYWVLGIGSWVMIVGLGMYLGMTVTGRVVTQPLLRGFGLLVMAVALSGFHALLFPNFGPLTGAQAGLLAPRAIAEITARFSGAGTLLILMAMFAMGAVVAIDQIVFQIPRWTLQGFDFLKGVRLPRLPSISLSRAAARTEPDLFEVEETIERAKNKIRKGRKIGQPAIDEDAGGVGATEAFDPEEHEVEDDTPKAVSKKKAREAADVEEDEPQEVETKSEERRRLTADELRAKIAKLPVRMAGLTVIVAREEDIPRAEENYDGYKFPPLDLLGDPESNFTEKMEQYVRQQAEILEQALQVYGIDGEVVGIESGPVVTLYSVQLAPGTKVAKVTAIASDLARALGAQNIRIVANMVGKTTVGVEVPNLKKEKVRLKELMSGGQAEGMVLPMFLGKDVSGEPLVADLTRMPHMLIAGTTGSGKSVCMNTIIMSWLYTKRPDELKLVLVDPKMVEMSQFADIPHLMCPVVTESARAAAILEWAVTKMEERYELFKEATVRDIAGYNALTDEEKFEIFKPENDVERAKIPKRLPYMVFVIDELADLILTNKEVEHSIVRIAQKARAVGIHLILATQRPQANVVTGLIKSNMPCRVSFKVASGMDSRIVLDQKGAELLLGQGDMLFLTPHTSEVKRAQGTLVSDAETRKVAAFLKNVAGPTFERSLIAIRPGTENEGDGESGLNPSERDPLFDEAVRIMIETGRGSVSLLQRRLAIGYSRSSRLVDQMGQAGILGEHKGSVAREVMITLEDWEQMKRLEEESGSGGGENSRFGDSQDDERMGEMSEADEDADIETMRRDREIEV